MARKLKPHLRPITPIKYISESEIVTLEPTAISKEVVGEKAFGLASLPPSWTLPFIVISDALLSEFRASTQKDKAIERYSARVLETLLPPNSSLDDFLIVRSSACKEGLTESGKFYSVHSNVKNFENALGACLQKIVDDPEIKEEKVPIIIQMSPKIISTKGHLSNERRFYKDIRDWVGQFEDKKVSSYFSVNLRYWRKKYFLSDRLEKRLECNLREQIPGVLKFPAAWANNQQVRVHFEWLWDGSCLYIVQAVEEHKVNGVNPLKVYTKYPWGSDYTPSCLSPITETHAKYYHKVRNVFTYQQLGLPVRKLYLIDDQKIINEIAQGDIHVKLRLDLQELVKYSLIIRTDVDIDDKGRLQLLPRTHVRTVDDAINWLIKSAKEIKASFPTNNIIFLFHNFIPAVSSAFAYAVPGQRKVQIEALWGLPEGLYYNTHDKYIVDTNKPNLQGIKIEDVSKFEVTSRVRCKQFCVIPDAEGKWITQPVSSSYQWKEAIQDQNWVKEIAYHSRRIAEKEQRPLSIMWFVGVPQHVCEKPIFPWFHETLDVLLTTKAPSQRTKTPFDITFQIRTSADLEKLRNDADAGVKNIRMIRIQPFEEALLRNKNTLRDIGELAKKIDAIILLEGGVLSHAYYQLMQTQATIEVVNPFERLEGKREFFKLVRDKVPDNIISGGENVSTAKLSGSLLLRALREKLVEEAFEVLDAVDQEAILGELADISEVIDGILDTLSCSREDLRTKQDQKRERAGGFANGTVLLKTANPALTKTKEDTSIGLFDQDENNTTVPIMPHDIFDLAHTVNKWSDRREHSAAKEVLLKLDVPLIRDSWTASTPETVVEAGNTTIVRAEVVGKRNGSRMEIQLSVFQSKQGKLFEDDT